jgi:hypothetical protein
VSAVFPLDLPSINEPEVGLVDDSRGLERAVDVLAKPVTVTIR